MVDLLQRIAGEKNATLAQVALAWLLAQKPWIVPLPDTIKVHRLDANLGAAALELTADDLRAIETAAAQIMVQGALSGAPRGAGRSLEAGAFRGCRTPCNQ